MPTGGAGAAGPCPWGGLALASVGPLGLDPGLLGHLPWSRPLRWVCRWGGLAYLVLLCGRLKWREPQGSGQFLEESWAVARWGGLEKAVEENPLVLGLPSRKRRVRGWPGLGLAWSGWGLPLPPWLPGPTLGEGSERRAALPGLLLRGHPDGGIPLPATPTLAAPR